MVAAVAVSLSACGQVHPATGPSTGSGVAALRQCAVGGGAFLDADDLNIEGTFVPFLTQALTGAPVHGGAGPGPAATAQHDFVAGRIEGFLVDFAVKGPYRDAEDAYAASIGYAKGQWPLVPLVGTVVSDHPGVLEVYQDNIVFSGAAGARTMTDIYRGTAATPGWTVEPWKPAGVQVDESFAIAGLPQPGAPVGEHIVKMVMRHGDLVVAVNVQGGAGVALDNTGSIGERAAVRVATSCSFAAGE